MDGDRDGDGGAADRARLDEDITALGELLGEHPFSPGRPGATAAMAVDFAQALDAYDTARRSADRDQRLARRTVEDGRYALARLDARMAGDPLPHRLPLCFFDARHGRAERQVSWRPDGGARRRIAVCAADAVRLADGERPLSAPAPASDPASAAPRTVPTARAAAPPLAPGERGRLRDRYSTEQLAWRVGPAGYAVYALLLVLLGAPDLAFIGIYVIIVAATVTGLAAAGTWLTGRALWNIVRRGGRVTAGYLRTEPPGPGRSRWGHVYGYTDPAGKEWTYRRDAEDSTVRPLAERALWLAPGSPKGLYAHVYPYWGVAALLLSAPAFLAGCAALLIVCPGFLLRALFFS
ncbi:hypothetical protein ACFV0Z_20545 [Streptomyces xiamenensis]|uniref:hypothetical protein n=1 Tax=Streptomyces xiamenensis TaxID=408015 RepID=UPI0036911B0E